MRTALHRGSGEGGDQRNPLELADLASGMGGLVLGVGLGALVGQALRPYAVAFILVGAAMHGWGMFRKHRLQRELFGPPLVWSVALNLLCWLWLILLLVLLYLRG